MLDSPIPCCCKCCFGAGGYPKQDEEFVCCNALHWFVCLGRDQYCSYVQRCVCCMYRSSYCPYCSSVCADRSHTCVVPRGRRRRDIGHVFSGLVVLPGGSGVPPFFLACTEDLLLSVVQMYCLQVSGGWLVAAPTNWVDMSIPSGSHCLEQRPPCIRR